MKIIDKINMNSNQLIENGPITIVAFGDSVTHGAVGPGEFDYETVFWNRLRRKINQVRNYVPINVINAGIGGTTAKSSLARMERDVFSHNPDLVIVCFGLNDINGPLDEYISSLSEIFKRCIEFGVQTIFMTPNMLNTYVSDKTQECYLDYAKTTAQYQNEGMMDRYIAAACEQAENMQIPICDCYSRWKKMSLETDTTALLANGINYPIREMHELFAQSIFDLIFEDAPEIKTDTDNAMWKQ